ncbi:MAG: hypothetical protein JXA30_11535 [Deltaproteobacteria bacterium]|nr:hypothetical protein [Deltaproteobacteria bacterium]
MAYIFLDDGYPDAREYDNNYLYFDENDLYGMERTMDALDRRAQRTHIDLSHGKRALERAIEKRRRALIEEHDGPQSSNFASLLRQRLHIDFLFRQPYLFLRDHIL